jgi:hypothetical protein
VRLAVARGSIEYSAVTQPFPDPRRNCGTVSSTEAVHNTRVFPTVISTDPSAVIRYPDLISTGRISSGRRLSTRIFHEVNEKEDDQDHRQEQQNQTRNPASWGGLRPGFFSGQLKLCHFLIARLAYKRPY